MMLSHYLRSALARFRKTPFTTGANILTLALGLACFIAAYGIAEWWRGADHYHPAADRIFVVGQTNRIIQGGPSGSQPVAVPQAISTWNLARYLRTDFPELEQVARVNMEADMPVSASSGEAILNIAIADPGFLDIFRFDFIEGDLSALNRPGGAVLTADAAARLFGGGPALGETVLINGAEEASVTAVIAPVRQPSFMGSGPDAGLRFDMIRDWSSTRLGQQLDGLTDSWIGIGPYTFVRLPPGMHVDDFNARMPAFIDRHMPAGEKAVAQTTMTAFPVSRLSTFLLDRALLSGSAGLKAAAVLIGLGALILLVACVNYANLATAQAAARVKEIGLRRTLGAGRAQIMTQAWVEAGLLTLSATLLALLVLALAVPAVRAQTGLDLLFFLSQGLAPLGALVLLIVAVTFAAGAWPALVLSGVRPASVLRPGQTRGGSKRIARVLVAAQFASASFLLIVVAVTQLQRAHLERAGLSLSKQPVIVLDNLATAGINFETLEARLVGTPGVESISIADRRPWSTARDPIYFTRTPAPDEQTIISAPMGYLQTVGHDFFATLGLDLLAGRGFERGRESISTSLYTDDPLRIQSVVLDETYARRMGFASPEEAVGQFIYMPAFTNARMSRPAITLQIIGVTEADVARLEAWRADGNIYVYGHTSAAGGQYPVLRIAREQVVDAVAAVTEAWGELAPAVPVNVQFFDEMFDQAYRQYAGINQLFILLAGAAFIIASVGLVGIAVHVAARRRHEIGVRKVLGASTGRVLRMLVADFSKPVIVGNIIAWPFAYMAAQTYLQSFAERTPLTPLPFILSLAITLLIAWLAVGGQAYRAARVKPALVLRAE